VVNQWKVIYVSSRAEKKVAERLISKGIEAYVPIKREMKQWSDRKKMVESPLINGYVFVKPEALQRDDVLQVQGALQYVRYNGGDAIIRDIEIEALKSIETKGYYVEAQTATVLKAGDKAIIQAGPFKGLQGTITQSAGKTLYTLVISGIDYSLSVQVPAEVLEKEK
jgi:transcription antitermination factor NusG